MSHNAMETPEGPKTELLRSYLLGFVLSVLLTLAAYFLVKDELLSGWYLIVAIFALGIIQAFVQLVCFLHLGKEENPKWKLIVFLFMLLVAAIVVIGSLWIMANLNYNVMPHMAP